MKRSNYIRWSKKMILSDLLGTITWVSLGTFMLMAKNAIGSTEIPIFELFIFLTSLVGIKIAHSAYATLKGGQLASIIQETIFLIVLYISLIYTNNLAIAGYIVYGVIIGSAVINKITAETSRAYEQKEFNTDSGNKALKLIRKKSSLTTTIGATIGSIISVVFISVFHVGIIQFTMVMLVLNVIQNMYDHYLWMRYLNSN